MQWLYKLREEGKPEERERDLKLISSEDHFYDLLCFSVIFSLKLFFS